jgi:hypothetical protein
MHRKHLAALFAFLLISLCSVARGEDKPAAQDPDEAIRDLFTQKKLFVRTEYKTLRKAFSQRFELLHKDAIRQAYGTDYDEMTAWLEDNLDIKEEFYTAIDEKHNSIESALRLFKDIYKQFPDKIKPYAELAIATAVTWDEPRKGVYDYQQHQVRTKSTLPGEGIGGLDNFKYIVDNERVMEGRGQHLPWEFLVYVVNHKTPLAERKWAVKQYLGNRRMIGRCYNQVPYDHGMLRNESPKLADHDYTLANIRSCGGVCAMQADFAARVGKCLGVPAEYVTGEGNSLGLHAWVMWVELKQVAKGKIIFSLESFGRYDIDKYYTGNVRDPQTGLTILDRDMELRLSMVGYDKQAKRHADLVMRAFPTLRDKVEMKANAQLAYLQGCMTVCPYNQDCWLAVAALSRDHVVKPSQATRMVGYGAKLIRTFRNFPDFTWKVLEDLLTIDEDAAHRAKLYEQLVAIYERAQRPDLACQARLKLADYLTESKEYKKAAEGLASTMMKFPSEGRYIPKLMDKLEEMCQQYERGNDKLKRFYVTFLPAIPGKRGDEPSKYCIAMHEKAIAFFRTANNDKMVANLERRLELLKAGAIR